MLTALEFAPLRERVRVSLLFVAVECFQMQEQCHLATGEQLLAFVLSGQLSSNSAFRRVSRGSSEAYLYFYIRISRTSIIINRIPNHLFKTIVAPDLSKNTNLFHCHARYSIAKPEFSIAKLENPLPRWKVHCQYSFSYYQCRNSIAKHFSLFLTLFSAIAKNIFH